MITFLQLIYTFAFKEKQGYRIKVAGDEERYVINVDGLIRSVLRSDFDNVPDAMYVVELIKGDQNNYKFRYCNGYISTVSDSKEIILKDSTDNSEDLETFEIKKKDNVLNFLNKKKNECLAQTDTNDEKNKGYELSTMPCGEGKTSFVLLDVGPIYYYCADQAQDFCKSKGFDLPAGSTGSGSIGKAASASSGNHGSYSTNPNFKFKGDFPFSYSGSANGKGGGFGHYNDHYDGGFGHQESHGGHAIDNNGNCLLCKQYGGNAHGFGGSAHGFGGNLVSYADGYSSSVYGHGGLGYGQYYVGGAGGDFFGGGYNNMHNFNGGYGAAYNDGFSHHHGSHGNSGLVDLYDRDHHF